MSKRKKRALLTLPSHVHRVRVKGRDYYYYQPFRGTGQQAQRHKLPGRPQEPEFWEAYHTLAGNAPSRAPAKTFDAAIAAYKQSPEFKEKRERTRVEYARHLAIISKAWGGLQLRGLKPAHVLKLRDGMADTPAKANHLIRVLSLLISWSIPRDFCDYNPCSGIKKLRIGAGYEPWPSDAIELLRSLARPEIWWACALGLYTGQRQSDVLTMKWSDMNAGEIRVQQEKTGRRLWIPVHATLRDELERIERRGPFIATNGNGRPWTQSGFRASWRRELAKPQFAAIARRGLVFHGLRKSSVVFLLEAGCTDAQVAAITGQSRQMVEHYALMVNQRRLAREGIFKWEGQGNGRE